MSSSSKTSNRSKTSRLPARSKKSQSANRPTSQHHRPHEGGQNLSWLQVGTIIFKILALIILNVINERVFQLSLFPVYGSIPSSAHWHFQPYTSDWKILFPLIFITASRFRTVNAARGKFLPPFALLALTIQYHLSHFSGLLGPRWGVAVTKLLTCTSLNIGSLSVAAGLMKTLYGPTRWRQVLLPWVLLGVFSTNEPVLESRIDVLSTIVSRAGLQHFVALFYAILFPSKFLLLCLLPLAHSAFYNIHLPLPYQTSHLNSTMRAHGFSLVARRESLTGYISVLDNLRDDFRVMRCDHSLLGGEWLFSAPDPFGIREPIYAVFVMLEAVRLIQPPFSHPKSVSDDEITKRSALVVGLGTGSTPSALIAHGISTTVLEIDPVVHEFATEYFSFPPSPFSAANHTTIIQDATVYVSNPANAVKKYDYIIHDVFTGGSEPTPLFTLSFLSSLRALLAPSTGAIAINYAGDLRQKRATRIVARVLRVFGASACRLFRETPPPPPDATGAAREQAGHIDFANLVIFCLNGPSTSSSSSTVLGTANGTRRGVFTFRPPTEADFLGSEARRRHLLPQHEVAWDDPVLQAHHDDDGDPIIITSEELAREAAADAGTEHQRERLAGAVGHWAVMRTVLPDVVWEMW
ncbi:MAG: hypothetical protein LQ351_002307 [Letrouitia transgressa]|nr:MAG: hypothetical protein LQ351_002307 [Letrouitia transgressa]